MPKLPTNMIRRKDRAGFWFRSTVGGRVRQIALGTDYREAIRRLRSLTSQRPSVVLDATVRVAAEQWLTSHCATRRTESGQRLARQRMNDHVLPHIGHMKLHRLTKDDVRALRLSLERTRLSAGTVVHVLSDVRSLLNWCEESGLVESSPFPAKVMPKLQERPPDRLTDQEAQRLRDLPGVHGFVCRLALGTGLRWGELTRSQASDVERGFLVVHRTKSGRVRRVPLQPQLLAEVRMRVGRLVPFAEFSPGSFAKAVRRATGIETFHVHQMRHTFACQALERGVSLSAVQKALGHAEITTTTRYAQLDDDAVMRQFLDASVTQASPRVS